MSITDSDGKPGLRIETASSVLARDMIAKHLGQFAPVMRRDRLAARSTVTEYTNGLAGAVALVIAGGHGSKEELIKATMAQFLEYLDRDLQHLKAT